MQHDFGGKVFKIHRYTFTVHEADGRIAASRYQFPIRLGYATTVDKAQGRTIASLVVDCYSLWKAAHIGVAMGRAICTNGLEVRNLNLNVAFLKHPAKVINFYDTPGIGVKQDRTCCESRIQGNVHNAAGNVIVHAFHFHVPANGAPNFGQNDEGTCNDSANEFNTETQFPYDMKTFIKSLLHSNPVAPRQKKRNEIIELSATMPSFQNFICDAYATIVDIFETCKIAPKKTKCNWCVMCAVIQDYLTSPTYLAKCCKGFDLNTLTSEHNRLSTHIFFSLLGKVVQSEKETLQNLNDTYSAPISTDMSDHERALLRYVAGATIHKVTKDLQHSASEDMIDNIHRAKIEYKCFQLLQSLHIPEGFAIESTDDPASLVEILRHQHHTRGLTIVSDAAFVFFKYLCAKIRTIQTFQYLEVH